VPARLAIYLGARPNVVRAAALAKLSEAERRSTYDGSRCAVVIVRRPPCAPRASAFVNFQVP